MRRTATDMLPKLRQYLDVEHLTLREMAAREHCGLSAIQYWRVKCGLPPASTFWRSFEEHYGPEARVRFVRMQGQGKSLAVIAREMGFSREWARIIAGKLREEAEQEGMTMEAPPRHTKGARG